MTRAEFIDAYCARSGVSEHKTRSGFATEGHERIAVTCQCGESDCPGWQMRSPESLLDDLRDYGAVR